MSFLKLIMEDYNVKEDFDPKAWANLDTKNSETQTSQTSVGNTQSERLIQVDQAFSEIAETVKVLVERNIDITIGYKNWLTLGFALADGLGESGRSFYHDLSRMNAEYDNAECDKQYTSCLRGKKSGTTIKSFFYMAKEAGIDISQIAKEHRSFNNCVAKEVDTCANNATVPTGTLSEKVGKIEDSKDLDKDVPSDILAQLAQLPGMTFTEMINREDWPAFCLPILDSQDDPVGRDKMILGSLNIISGVLPKSLYSIYDRRRIYPSLYTIVYGGFASKKGDLEACRKLIEPVKQQMRQQYEKEVADYELALANWENAPKASRGKMPEKPTPRSPFIPANSSASAVYRALAANGGWGEIFDTEADTLTNMLSKKEYGDFSDLLRKAHHHEECSMARVGEQLFIEITEPRLSVLLTCTESQLPPLLAFDNFVNGLASRFLFYALLNGIVEFRNVFEGSDRPIEDTYKELGEQLFVLYQALQERVAHPIQFVLSKAQQAEFMKAFKKMLKEHYELFGDGIQGFIFRLALECYRITMVLTALRRLSERLETGECLFDENEQALCCDDRDFHIALTIIECLVKHTVRIYEVFSQKQENPFQKSDKKNAEQIKNLYMALPNEQVFKTAEAVEIAQRLQIPERTAKRYLKQLVKDYKVLDQPRQGVYQKSGKEVLS